MTISRKQKLDALFALQESIREFFKERDFLETPTPPLVTHPGMEPHLHPFRVKDNLYLHTSPEFHMKELLSLGYEKIFSLGYCFRDEPRSSTHRPQFLMLEWYRAGERYETIAEDVKNLLDYLLGEMSKDDIALNVRPGDEFREMTVDELFRQTIGFSFKDYSTFEDFKERIAKTFPELLPAELDQKRWSWDDLFFLVFLNKIEPELKNYPKLLLKEYPASQAALSTIKEDDPTVCERFEIYLRGIEVANCFNELCNLDEQKKRYQKYQKEKERLYGYKLGEPEVLYRALEKGLPCPSAGIALGVERLLMGLTGIENPFFD